MEKIRAWVDGVREESEALVAYLLYPEPDDTFQWQQILSGLDREEAVGGLLLSGPAGCGKHTVAAHMIKLLDGEFETVVLDGMELCAQGLEVAVQRLKLLLKSCMDENQPLCLLVENLENCDCRREILSLLGKLLYKYFGDASLPALFLILIDQREQELPSLLRRRLQRFHMNLPDLYQRRKFVERKGKQLKGYVSLDTLAEKTEGATYAQLLDLIAYIDNLLNTLEDGVLSEDALDSLLASQLPEPQPQDTLNALARSARQLVEQLPQILKEAVAARGTVMAAMPSMEAPKVALQAQVDQDEQRAKFEQMSVRELSVQMWGEERVAEMESKFQQLQLQS